MKYAILLLIAAMVFTGCTSRTTDPMDRDEENGMEDRLPVETEHTDEETDNDVNGEIQDPDTGLLDMVGRSPLTGNPTDRPYKPVVVMIENSTAARPQTGLIDADVVYELMVEGRITRFMAVYNDHEIETVGPVRSTRHYYLDLFREWGSIFVHYGGSSFANDVYNQDPSIRRIDGMVRGAPFWRDSSRRAPHNAYVDLKSSRDELDTTPEERGFLFTLENLYEGSPYTTITLPYHTGHTINSYRYDSEEMVHYRYINGEPHMDREREEQITVKNIIVQYAPHTAMGTTSGHIDIALIGSGRAQFMLEGVLFEGTWEKMNEDGKTYFYDEDGSELMLKPGNTWIQIVPIDLVMTVD